jgi:hypothetical protein
MPSTPLGILSVHAEEFDGLIYRCSHIKIYRVESNTSSLYILHTFNTFTQSDRRRLVATTPLWNLSIASPIFPTCPPPLFPEPAVENWLPQFLIDVVVCLAKPPPEIAPAPELGHILLKVRLEVLGAGPARV